jgi:hypothetical protein
MLAFNIVTFFALFFIPAHYGRFYDDKKSFVTLPNKLAWFLEEIPNLGVSTYYMYYYIIESQTINWINFLMIGFFFVHYVHRALVFPLKIANTKKMPIEIIFLGATFCFVNGLMQNRSIFLFSNYRLNNLYSPSFVTGVLVYLLGMYINIYHDYHMINLKKGSSGYFIPYGFLFDYISCPNYFGEIIEWIGYALCCQTFSGWIFAFATFSNLFPRAIDYHKWYNSKFKNEYPKSRKAIIPFII